MTKQHTTGGDRANGAPRQDQTTLNTPDCAGAAPTQQAQPVSYPQGDLFGPAEFAPTWPTPGTLDRLALEMLLSGAKVTHPDFQAATGSWRMAACVERLRHRHDWPVLTAEIPAPTRRRPGRVIGLYSMRSDALQTVQGRAS